jgi:hypothetical protein
MPQQSAPIDIDWMLWITVLSLMVTALALVVAIASLCLQFGSNVSQKRYHVARRCYERIKNRGYELKSARRLSYEQAWEWFDRVARFFESAIGDHARELVLQDFDSLKGMQESGQSPGDLIQWALTRMHKQVMPLITEASIAESFDHRLWRKWSPAHDTPL